MRWDDTAKKTLWQTFWDTHVDSVQVSIDVDKIAQAWPEPEKPSAKAVCEFLKGFRKRKNIPTAAFSISSPQTSTPRKSKAKTSDSDAAPAQKTPESPTKKRKTSRMVAVEVSSPSKQGAQKKAPAVKEEQHGEKCACMECLVDFEGNA